MVSKLGLLGACAFVIVLGGDAAAASHCSSGEIAAAGKKASRKAKCWSKATKHGQAVDGTCLDNAETKFSTAYAKAEGKGDCINTTDAGTVETMVDDFLSDLVTEINGSTGTPTGSKCSSTQLAAAAKKAGSLLKCYAKATSEGSSLDSECTGKATTKFHAKWLKATGDCNTAVSEGDIETKIDDFAAAVNATLASPSTTTTSTTTSTTSTTACVSPTSATTTTTIPATCGDNVIDPGEQCDPPGSSCGAGASCSADCTCPCDFLDPSVCLYPFPSDWMTIADPTTDTGRRLHFAVASMPRNNNNVPIEPGDYNWNDGFSPGESILLKVPDVDLGMTGAAPITDIARSLDADAPIVLVNASTLAHHLFFAELDANATTDANRTLILRPSVNLAEGTRYIVALRRMKDASGALIAPNPDFLAYRDGTPTADPVKEARRPHMEDIFTTLGAAGVDRADLYLAWDFTVASRRNITERLLFMRDDAFDVRLSGLAPAFTVTQVENNVDDRIYRRVTGTYQVDRYVDQTTPPARLVLGPDGLPLHQCTPQPASFICNIPRAALPSDAGPAVPARASIYGHGLLGSNTEVSSSNVRSMANEHNFVFCATKWIGMSNDDVPNAIGILQNLANFPTLTDRLQQAMVNQLFLARLMIHAQGFVSDPSFQDASGTPVIDTSDVFYDGNSQGGIFGGMVMAIAQDITRGVLGVPAINYSTLLTRSTDFDAYSAILYPAYPNELERPLLLALIQLLWDRSDPNGYAHHITSDPLPNTPAHKILIHEAFGDHQVANVATEVEARTLGLSVHQPALAAGRSYEVVPFYGIPAIPSYPFDGSALIMWDSGSAQPPTTNTPPRPGRCQLDPTRECSCPGNPAYPASCTNSPQCPADTCVIISTGFDPHSDPRNFVDARTQKSEFLKTNGAVVDVCGGMPCVAPH